MSQSLIDKHVTETMSRSRSGSKKKVPDPALEQKGVARAPTPPRGYTSNSPTYSPTVSPRHTHLMTGDDVDRNMRYALEKTNDGELELA